MRFIQTISYTTAKPEEMRAIAERFQQENPAAPGLVSVKLLKARDGDNAYLLIAEFESYELAMENFARPETDAFAKQMAALADSGPEYGNYDLMQEFNP